MLGTYVEIILQNRFITDKLNKTQKATLTMGNSTIRHGNTIKRDPVVRDCSACYGEHADPIRTTIE